MAYVVDRVVVCDAFREPDKHYQLLPGGRSRLAGGRRPSMRFLASAKDVRGGISGVVGKETGLFDDLSARVATLTRQLHEIIDTDVATFNAQVHDANLPALIPPTTVNK